MRMADYISYIVSIRKMELGVDDAIFQFLKIIKIAKESKSKAPAVCWDSKSNLISPLGGGAW